MKIVNLLLGLTIGLLSISNLCQAFEFEDIIGNDRTEEIDYRTFVVLELSVGNSNLKDILFMMEEIKKNKKDKWGNDQFCYKSSEDDTALVIGIDGLTFSCFQIISKLRGIQDNDGCIESSLINKEISTDNGIKLGLNRQQIKRILGVPIKETKKGLFYRNEWKLKMTELDIRQLLVVLPNSEDTIRKEPYWFVKVLIDAIFDGDKLTSITVSKSISN